MLKLSNSLINKRILLLIGLLFAVTIGQAGALAPTSNPVIDVWYGTTQSFGDIGTPQQFVNIVGTISDPDGINESALTYKLNSDASLPYNIGPNNQRLAEAGDFNIDLPISSLNNGANTLRITAKDDLNNSTTQIVTINYTDANTWPLPSVTDWSELTDITEGAQIVDGQWAIEGEGVRPQELDFMRAFAIGDLDWVNYTVIAPITFHELDDDPDRFGSTSVRPAVGFLTHWTGHTDAGPAQQPKASYNNRGIFAHIHWTKDLSTGDPKELETMKLLTPDNNSVGDIPFNVDFGKTYIFKVQTEKPAAATKSTFRMKVWEQGTAEPATWQLEAQGLSTSPKKGSILLAAHHVDVTFGRVIVLPNNQDNLELTTSTSGNGTVARSNPGPYISGDQVTLTATAAPGWQFTGWTGDVTSSNNPLTITMNSDTEVTANFSESVSLTVNKIGNGSVSRSDNGPYVIGDKVTLTATAADGWKFDGWSGDVTSTNNPLTVTLNDDTTVTATFSALPVNLTVNTTGNGTVNRSDPGPYVTDDVVTLTAVPADGWKFAGWSGDVTSNSAQITITLDEDKTVMATFTQVPPELTVTSNGNGSVTVSDPGPYTIGQKVTITATPAPGYEFDGWTGTVTSSSNPLVLTLNADHEIQANFSIDEPTDVEYFIYLPTIHR